MAAPFVVKMTQRDAGRTWFAGSDDQFAFVGVDLHALGSRLPATEGLRPVYLEHPRPLAAGNRSDLREQVVRLVRTDLWADPLPDRHVVGPCVSISMSWSSTYSASSSRTFSVILPWGSNTWFPWQSSR